MKKIFLLMASVFILTLSSNFVAKAGQWENSASGWRYQNDDGSYIKSNWFYDKDGSWYYFNSDGYMQKEWILDNGKWYYLDYPNGYLQTNMWISGKYFVGADGVMLTNTTTPDGYKVGEDGVWIEDGESIFKKLAGEYGYSNRLRTHLKYLVLKEDGTFSGDFKFQNTSRTKSELLEVTGRFINPKKINNYTYSFEIGELQYKNAIEGKKRKDEMLHAYEISEFVEKGKYFYVYLEGTELNTLPKSIQEYSGGGWFYEEENNKLKSKIIYNLETEGFIVYGY